MGKVGIGETVLLKKHFFYSCSFQYLPDLEFQPFPLPPPLPLSVLTVLATTLTVVMMMITIVNNNNRNNYYNIDIIKVVIMIIIITTCFIVWASNDINPGGDLV